MNKIKLLLIGIMVLTVSIEIGCGSRNADQYRSDKLEPIGGEQMMTKVVKSDDEWKDILTEKQFRILREKGTESPFTGEYTDLEDEGVYHCAACGSELFSSSTKFHSGCGWPSYYEPLLAGNVIEKRDVSLGMVRTEILCAACESHLGHVFEDGPPPTGLRYCINSAAMKFEPVGKTPPADK